ncbi:MAG TPA: class A beta-lactamase [Fimbriimonas sp.]|nr:class A beta-lactamase [Fimbriimonas sp.]
MIILPSLLLIAPVKADVGSQLAAIEAASKGKLGAAIVTPRSAHYSRKNERFSLQSVMKLVVSMAALDLVDRGKWKLDQKITFRRSDLSLSVQPIADLLGKKQSVAVTPAQCIEFTVTQSCSGAGDFLIRKMGGVQVVNNFLKKHNLTGMSVDRQERDLQTQIGGIRWKPEFINAAKLEAAFKAVPQAQKDAAYKRYQNDLRDTTTLAAMASLLQKLITGKLLSPSSTKYLMGVMERTQTGPDRLQAGVKKGWTLGHKTGTSSSHRGVACATNDVGFAKNAKGEWVIIVALLKNSTLKYEEREAVLSRVAKVAFENR